MTHAVVHVLLVRLFLPKQKVQYLNHIHRLLASALRLQILLATCWLMQAWILKLDRLLLGRACLSLSFPKWRDDHMNSFSGCGQVHRSISYIYSKSEPINVYNMNSIRFISWSSLPCLEAPLPESGLHPLLTMDWQTNRIKARTFPCRNARDLLDKVESMAGTRLTLSAAARN